MEREDESKGEDEEVRNDDSREQRKPRGRGNHVAIEKSRQHQQWVHHKVEKLVVSLEFDHQGRPHMSVAGTPLFEGVIDDGDIFPIISQGVKYSLTAERTWTRETASPLRRFPLLLLCSHATLFCRAYFFLVCL